MKNMFKNFAIIMLSSLFWVIPSFTNEDKIQAMSINNDQSNINTQVYLAEDGTEHTIYWAQGIDAPKMDNGINLGKPGYFKKVIEYEPGKDPSEVTYTKYVSGMEDGKGYFDVNKNPSRTIDYPQIVAHHCYLASAINLIHWWMEQNSDFIDSYLNHIRSNDNVYKQLETLKPLSPIDENLWKNLRSSPKLEKISLNNTTAMSQELANDKIYQYYHSIYGGMLHGYCSDLVLDSFFNGYAPYSPLTDEKDGYAPENTVDMFTPSKLCGFFYPIFYKERICDRAPGGNAKYETCKREFKKAFTSGKAMTISYKSMGNTYHAITMWGAEYDNQGELVRIFVTDSDDYSLTDKADNNSLTGMFSYDIVTNSSGGTLITQKFGSKVVQNNYVSDFTTLDLKSDLLKEKINDINKPIKPSFNIQPSDGIYPTVDIDMKKLSLEVKREDTGYYLYQWYSSSNESSKGNKIEGATSQTYLPPKATATPVYYYCEVTNFKNGYLSESAKTRYAKVCTNADIINARKPRVEYLGKLKQDYTQYQQPKPIIISATSIDGGTLSYQWYHKVGMDNSPTGGEILIGETSNIFYPNNVCDYEDLEQHIYYCVVTNTNLTVNGNKVAKNSPSSSPAVTVIYSADFNNALNPVIINQSQSKNYNDYQVDTLSISAKSLDRGNLSYQWYVNDSLIDGANSSSYTPVVSKPGNYKYYCMITNTNNKALVNKMGTLKSEDINIVINDNVPQSSNTNLKVLTIDNFNIIPNFDKDILNYSLTVPFETNRLNITATAEDVNASVDVINKDLVVGKVTDILIKVKAENGDTKTYTIEVTRENKLLSSNNYLKYIKINNSILDEFIKDKLEYDLVVENNVSNIDIIAVSEDSKATVNSFENQPLIVGENNEFKLICIAEDNTQRTYTINIFRKDIVRVPSDNNYLISIKINGIEINDFDKAIMTYEVIVKSDINKISIEAVSEDKSSLISGDKEVVISDKETDVRVICTAENGQERIYTIKIVKEIEKSDDVDFNPWIVIAPVGVICLISILGIIILNIRRRRL